MDRTNFTTAPLLGFPLGMLHTKNRVRQDALGRHAGTQSLTRPVIRVREVAAFELARPTAVAVAHVVTMVWALRATLSDPTHEMPPWGCFSGAAQHLFQVLSISARSSAGL